MIKKHIGFAFDVVLAFVLTVALVFGGMQYLSVAVAEGEELTDI